LQVGLALQRAFQQVGRLIEAVNLALEVFDENRPDLDLPDLEQSARELFLTDAFHVAPFGQAVHESSGPALR